MAGKAWTIKLGNFQLVAFTLQRNNVMSVKIFAGLSHRRAPKKKTKKNETMTLDTYSQYNIYFHEYAIFYLFIYFLKMSNSFPRCAEM